MELIETEFKEETEALIQKVAELEDEISEKSAQLNEEKTKWQSQFDRNEALESVVSKLEAALKEK